jgi:hypothetical protein
MLWAAAFVLIYSSRQNPLEKSIAAKPVDLDRCITRGVDHFKTVGSYPTISDGRYASNVARQRCQRTTTAFP